MAKRKHRRVKKRSVHRRRASRRGGWSLGRSDFSVQQRPGFINRRAASGGAAGTSRMWESVAKSFVPRQWFPENSDLRAAQARDPMKLGGSMRRAWTPQIALPPYARLRTPHHPSIGGGGFLDTLGDMFGDFKKGFNIGLPFLQMLPGPSGQLASFLKPL